MPGGSGDGIPGLPPPNVGEMATAAAATAAGIAAGAAGATELASGAAMGAGGTAMDVAGTAMDVVALASTAVMAMSIIGGLADSGVSGILDVTGGVTGLVSMLATGAIMGVIGDQVPNAEAGAAAAESGKELVCAGAKLQCAGGTAPATLVVQPRDALVDGKPVAIVESSKPPNIATFGMCTSASNPEVAAAQGAPQPCSAVCAPWVPEVTKYLVADADIPVSVKDKCTCTITGMEISVIQPGQTEVKAT